MRDQNSMTLNGKIDLLEGKCRVHISITSLTHKSHDFQWVVLFCSGREQSILELTCNEENIESFNLSISSIWLPPLKRDKILPH